MFPLFPCHNICFSAGDVSRPPPYCGCALISQSRASCSSRLPGVGRFFNFLKTTPGYILCIFLPFFLLILMEGINCVRLFKRYKSEEQREIQAQQANLERQREENQRMMQELMEMKARLEEKEKTPEEPPQA